MSSKRVIMIIIGVILVTTLACSEGVYNTSGRVPTDAPNEPIKSLYFKTTAGTYSISWWYPWQGSKHTVTCTGQATIEMVIWPATGEVNMDAYYSRLSGQDDCSLAGGMSVMDFDGSLDNDGGQSLVRFSTCSTDSGRARGTALASNLINPYHLEAITTDDVFIGGAYCDQGTATDGSTYTVDFTAYYLGEYKP